MKLGLLSANNNICIFRKEVKFKNLLMHSFSKYSWNSYYVSVTKLNWKLVGADD